MKFRFTYTLFVLSALCLLFVNNSNGPAEVQGIDRTGSPLSPGPCQACHGSGAFSPGIEVAMLDGSDPIDTYEPGKTYTLRVTATHSGSPAGFGFQAVALQSDDSQAGNFTNPGDDVQITPLNGRQYPEQSNRSNTNTFEVDWQAPETGTGEVDIYASIVVANGGSGSGGDGSVFLNTPVSLSEGVVSAINTHSLLESLSVFPNPVQEELNLSIGSKENAAYLLTIHNLQGQMVNSRQIELIRGEQLFSMNVSDLPSGVYTLMVTDGERSSSRKILKR